MNITIENLQGVLTEFTTDLGTLSKVLAREYGDKGSCLLNYNLKVDGKQIVPQPAQGSATCDYVYGVIKTILIESGIDESRISTDYGSMD